MKGTWIALKGMMPPEFAGKHYCSNCHHTLHLALNGKVYNFCPNCGADMRPEQIEPKMGKCYKCGWWNYSHGCQSEKGICEYEPIQTEQGDWNCAVCENFKSITEENTMKCIYCNEGSNFQKHTEPKGESHEIRNEGR